MSKSRLTRCSQMIRLDIISQILSHNLICLETCLLATAITISQKNGFWTRSSRAGRFGGKAIRGKMGRYERRKVLKYSSATRSVTSETEMSMRIIEFIESLLVLLGRTRAYVLPALSKATSGGKVEPKNKNLSWDLEGEPGIETVSYWLG